MAQVLLKTTQPNPTNLPDGGDIINDNFTELYNITDNLVISADVQAWDADLDIWATKDETDYFLLDGTRTADKFSVSGKVGIGATAEATRELVITQESDTQNNGLQIVGAAGSTKMYINVGGAFVFNSTGNCTFQTDSGKDVNFIAGRNIKSELGLNDAFKIHDVADNQLFTVYEATGNVETIGTMQATKFNMVTQETYTVTNPSIDRGLNVTGDTTAQVAAVLGTLISDLQTAGLIA